MNGRKSQMQMFSGRALRAENSKGKDSHAAAHLAYSRAIKESRTMRRAMSGRTFIQKAARGKTMEALGPSRTFG